VFKPVELPTLRFSEAAMDLKLPIALPRDAVAAIPPKLPEGWKAAWYTEWEVKDPALRKPENASQVIKLEKATTSMAAPAWFTITFKPGFIRVESTFARRVLADTEALGETETQIRAINSTIDSLLRDGIHPENTRLKAYQDKKNELTTLAGAYKEALAGYKELTTFDVPIELPEAAHLATVHFARDKN
jgi:hypothetical protein